MKCVELTHLARYILRQNFATDLNKFELLRIQASFDQMLDYLQGWLKNWSLLANHFADVEVVYQDEMKVSHFLTLNNNSIKMSKYINCLCILMNDSIF